MITMSAAFSISTLSVLLLLLSSTLATASSAIPCYGPGIYPAYQNTMKALLKGTSPSSLPFVDCLLMKGTYSGASSKAVYRRVVQVTFRPALLFQGIRDNLDSVLEKDSDNHINLAWKGGYVSEAALVAFQKTGQRRFLKLFTAYFDEVITRRDDKRGVYDKYHKRVMKAWGAWTLDDVASGVLPKNTHVACIAPNARIVYPATLFAKIVKTNPALWSAYGEKADAYIKIAKETLDEFDQDWKPINGVVWYSNPYWVRAEPINHVHIVASAWLNLAQYTTDATKYNTRVQHTIDVFTKSVHYGPDGKSVYWNYFPYFAVREKREYDFGKLYSEPIFKASLTAPFLLRANAQGFPLPASLLESVVNTITDVCLKGSQVLFSLSPVRSHYVSPKADEEYLSTVGNIVILAEFETISSTIKSKLSYLLATRPDIFPGAWMHGSHSLLGYAYYL